MAMACKKIAIFAGFIASISGTPDEVVNLTKQSFESNVTVERPQMVMFYHQG